MSLIHGEPITAEEIERLVSRQFTPTQFAALCNAVAWATAGRRCPSVPSFTERTNVKDHGIDAEWEVEMPNDGNYASPLVGPGWNVYQYKQRDIFAQGRASTFSTLMSGLKGAVQDLYLAAARRPDRYVVFTNLDLTHLTKGQKGDLKKSIRNGYSKRHKVQIEIIGAAELAALLNDLPHLRSSYFATSLFTTWEYAWLAHTKDKVFSTNVKLIGRDDELKGLRAAVDDPGVRVVLMAGSHNIGKTRLALHGMEHRQADTVVALDPRSMNVKDLLALESPGREVVVIIEDPDTEKAEAFMHQALARQGLKIVITLPTVEKAPPLNFGQDDRVKSITIPPLSAAEAQKLLEAAGAQFDYSMESWLIDRAGGNPGILLLAAKLGDAIRQTTDTFLEGVATAFVERVRRELGPDAVPTLELLSLLTSVGVRGAPSEEVEKICTMFGDGLPPHKLKRGLPALEKAGVLRFAGSYVEVVPPLLANWLAAAALRDRFTELCMLFAMLSRSARLRLVQRLSLLRAEEVDLFWQSIFGPEGLLNNLPSALANGRLLHLIAGTVPERVSQVVEKGLESMTVDERRQIDVQPRRELIWAIEELLFRERTSASAIRSLALLAEAGTTNNANPAAGIFAACFTPYHSQMPISLNERRTLLRSFLAPQNSLQLRLVAVGALRQVLSQVPTTFLRRGGGAQPFDPQSPTTYGQAWDYIAGSLDLLIEAALTEAPAVAGAALDHLPEAIAESALLLLYVPEAVVARCRKVLDHLIKNEISLPVPDLLRSLRRVRAIFVNQKARSKKPWRDRYQQAIKEMDGLINLIDKGDFSTAVKRWAGQWTPEHYGTVGKDGIEKYDKELRTLARQAVSTPSNLSDDLLAWLCSKEGPNAHRFFWWLGNHDKKRLWLTKMEELGATIEGEVAFSRYFGGHSKIDPAFVSDELDRLTSERRVRGAAIISATGFLVGDMQGVLRAETLIREQRADPIFVEQWLSSGGWLKPLSQGEYLRLLRAIAGPQLENVVPVIHFLTMWLHNKREMDGELGGFAASVVEAALPLSPANAWHFDVVASKLARADLERGFALLEKLLAQPYGVDSWSPLRRDGRSKLWQVLHTADRARAVRLVLSIALQDAAFRYQITHDLRTVLDEDNADQSISQEGDADILIAFALEGERQAELIGQSITASLPNFWGIALKIVEKHPGNETILRTLARGAQKVGQVVEGYWSDHIEGCLRDVEALLDDAATPTVARPWLKRLKADFGKEVRDSRNSEAEERVKGWEKVAEDPMAPERVWAIQTLIHLGKVGEIRKVISKDELLQMIPKLNLSAAENDELRRAIESWR